MNAYAFYFYIYLKWNVSQKWIFIAQILDVHFKVTVKCIPPLLSKNILLCLVSDEIHEISIVGQFFLVTK